MKETSEKYGLKKYIDLTIPPQEIKDLLEATQERAANRQTKTTKGVNKLIIRKYGFRIKS